MKLWHILGGITLSAMLTGAALAVPQTAAQQNGVQPNQPAISGSPVATGAASQAAIAMPAITGTVNLNQRIALPPHSALTVTVSDASVPDAPSRVVAQSVAWTDGLQAPFTFSLPYNPADIQPNARILLSAAVTLNNHVILATQDIQPVITNGVTTANLTLIPVESIALPTKDAGGMLTPSSPPVPLTEPGLGSSGL